MTSRSPNHTTPFTAETQNVTIHEILFCINHEVSCLCQLLRLNYRKHLPYLQPLLHNPSLARNLSLLHLLRRERPSLTTGALGSQIWNHKALSNCSSICARCGLELLNRLAVGDKGCSLGQPC